VKQVRQQKLPLLASEGKNMQAWPICHGRFLLVYSARLLLNDLDRRISQNSREAACRYELFIPTHLANGAAHQYCFVACQFQPLTTWIESAFSFTFSSYF